MKDIIDLINPPKLEVCYLDSLKQKIIQRLKDTGLADAKFKFEVKNILYVCVLIESSVNKTQRIDKRGFLLSLYKEVYGLSLEDEEKIKSIVDMLHINKKIRQKSYYKLWCINVFREFKF
jgi:hypothetical protein